MTSTTVTYEELKKLTGYDTPAAVTAFLIRSGIPYLPAKRGRPVTTTGLIEAAAIQAAGKSSPTQSSIAPQSQTIDV